MPTDEPNGEFLLDSREHLFERLTAILDFLNAQSACPNLKQAKTRYALTQGLYDEYNQLEAQIRRYNSLQTRERKLSYRNERTTLDDLVARIHESYDELVERTEKVSTELPTTRLPKLSLPIFNGGFREWQSFQEIYEAMVHKAQLPPIEKFQRLKSCLQGEPLRLIDHFTPSGENYPLAYQTLLDRYNNPRIAANAYLYRLLSFKQCQTNTHASLQSYLSNHYDTVKAYKALSIRDPYDYLLFQICYSHLDRKTQGAFDAQYPVSRFPTYDELMQFVQNQLRTLELHAVECERTERTGKSSIKHMFNVTGSSKEREQEKVKAPCFACTKNHPLVSCPVFANLSVSQRYELLKKNYLCFNCFRKHQRHVCNSPKRCKRCGGTHHTLLHTDREERVKPSPETSNASKPSTSTNEIKTESAAAGSLTCMSAKGAISPKYVLLGTAKGFIVGPKGKPTLSVRILLDPGSQVSCITRDIVDRLNIKLQQGHTEVKGLSGASVQASGRADCTIFTSHTLTKGFHFSFLVLPAISDGLSETRVTEAVKQRFRKYKLADPDFDRAGRIDVLIGADYYYEVVSDKRVVKGKPNGVHTAFGLVLIGEVPSRFEPNGAPSCFLSVDALDQALTRFWETEAITEATDPNDAHCEEFFKQTLQRISDGRYVVGLPFNCSQPMARLGNNRKNALHRLQAMERRFAKNEQLHRDYTAFMREYQELGHMSAVTDQGPYVIPHHAVCKESTTTKLRVVFDASNVGENGVSLNQLLHTGPKLQNDIFITLTRFRSFKVALVADIKMMYRQILVRVQDRPFQRILWRASPTEDPQEFQMNTVTYGLACSPYLAQRVIKQLVEDEGRSFPLASNALRNHIYVDDIVAGGHTEEEALQLHSELIELLGRGGFFPRKWTSSAPAVLKGIPNEHQETPLQIHEGDVIYKVLGLRWDPKLDSFMYHVEPFKGIASKRAVLSYIARMFDPLGWLTPFVFYCKYFIQTLWLEGVGWDDPLSNCSQQQWDRLVGNIPCLAQIRIPRYVFASPTCRINVIGFCDASEKGFAAVLYLRAIQTGTVAVSLLGGRSRVAPVKPLSIPRLELNAAHLLAKLLDSFKPALNQWPVRTVTLYSDSQVVLGWLRTPPHKLKTYVCNRVVDILNKTMPEMWHHVKSEENAADCASRGLYPRELAEQSCWWQGPAFLHNVNWEPIATPVTLIELPELKTEARVLTVTTSKGTEDIVRQFERFSSLSRLTRVLAYVLRWSKPSQGESRCRGQLKLQEVRKALNVYIQLNQAIHFSKEIAAIRAGSTATTLRSLAPFIDQRGLLRVGGRLGNAPLPYDTRHPLLVPYRSHLARLIVTHHHHITGHGGPQSTRASIQRQFWVPKVGNLIKSIIFACTTCRRHTAKPMTPMMGDLPPSRFDQVRPFLRVGTDFAGPFNLRETPRRKAPSFKAYVCIFICFSTKAVHLEIATALTTESFLAALDRFIARRGLCAFIHSDNGTNFTGAARKLSEVTEFLNKNANLLEEQLARRQIQWCFNPPAAPHFGGLWEAAVKSFKFHLYRITGAHAFTLEEFSTVTCRIEAILNSRPLGPTPTAPEDAEIYLTPGHFLIGAPLLAAPEVPLTDEKISTLSRWQLITQCIQSFWKMWSRSYLLTLLPRRKWQVNRESLKSGDVVIIRKDKTSPLSWPLAKVEKVFAGKDGVVRVAQLKCKDHTLTRPVHTLCKLLDGTSTSTLQ